MRRPSLIYARQTPAGRCLSRLNCSFSIIGPRTDLGSVINVFRETEASLGMFEQILDTPVDRRPSHPVAVSDLQVLEFDDVTFTHQTASAPALADVSFRVDRGETVAFVGPSGAGKTTLVKLLVGLYQPRGGRILYNSVDNTHIDLDRFRERIGLVTQDA